MSGAWNGPDTEGAGPAGEFEWRGEMMASTTKRSAKLDEIAGNIFYIEQFPKTWIKEIGARADENRKRTSESDRSIIAALWWRAGLSPRQIAKLLGTARGPSYAAWLAADGMRRLRSRQKIAELSLNPQSSTINHLRYSDGEVR